MGEYQTIRHTFEPVWDKQSEILILGTFPSVKSRENHFYYGHPQNRFWKLLAGIYQELVPETIEEKKQLILEHHLAVWDVIDQCDIIGSSDSSIRNVVPSDLAGLLAQSNIHTIIANGAKAYDLYQKHQMPVTGRNALKLPSTSPANAAWSLQRLQEVWGAVLRGSRNQDKSMHFLSITASDTIWKEVGLFAQNCSWRAGKALARSMSDNIFTDWERVIVALYEKDIAGYCTVAKKDCIADVPYTPYIGYLFVDEKYRGQRLGQKLISYAMSYLRTVGFQQVFLVSDHENLYEKYGFHVIDKKAAPWGAMEKIYMHDL